MTSSEAGRAEVSCIAAGIGPMGAPPNKNQSTCIEPNLLVIFHWPPSLSLVFHRLLFCISVQQNASIQGQNKRYQVEVIGKSIAVPG